jgi:hypothetical protein
LHITETIEPDQIIWPNLKHSMDKGGARKLLVNIVAFGVVLVTIVSAIYFSGQLQNLGLNIDCNNFDSTKEEAYKRQRQLDTQQ